MLLKVKTLLSNKHSRQAKLISLLAMMEQLNRLSKLTEAHTRMHSACSTAWRNQEMKHPSWEIQFQGTAVLTAEYRQTTCSV